MSRYLHLLLLSKVFFFLFFFLIYRFGFLHVGMINGEGLQFHELKGALLINII